MQMVCPDVPVENASTSSLRREVFTMLHAVPTAGHFGVLRTLHRVRQRFYWPLFSNSSVGLVSPVKSILTKALSSSLTPIDVGLQILDP